MKCFECQYWKDRNENQYGTCICKNSSAYGCRTMLLHTCSKIGSEDKYMKKIEKMTKKKAEAKRSEFKVGDNVWYFDAWGTLRNGIIYEIGKEYVLTKEGEFGGIQAGAKFEDCYLSEKECLEAERRRSDAQKEEYKESINSIEDLVWFLYNHDINSEHADWEAKEAAEERAAEFGINLK